MQGDDRMTTTSTPRSRQHAVAPPGQEVNLNGLWNLDVATLTWTQMADATAPQPRHGHTASWIADGPSGEGRLLVTGGTGWNTSRPECRTGWHSRGWICR
jgi:hypothetical protein